MTDVVVVGSVNMDLVVRLSRLPAPGETVSDGDFLRAHGGKGANQAAAAAALGARTSLVGAVGADDLGAEAREDLRHRGVDLAWLAEVDAPTGVALILVDAGGGNLIAVAPGANLALTSEHVKLAMEALLEEGTVVLGGLEVAEEAVATAASGALEHGATFVLNPSPARPLESDLIGRCDVVIANEHEIGRLGYASPGELLSAGAGSVVVTHGAEGAELHRSGTDPSRHPAPRVRAVDTTGAGDAFAGAFVWAMSRGHDLSHATEAGVAAGANATLKAGARASLASPEDLETLLSGSSP